MKIIANGEPFEIDDGSTLPQFLEGIGHRVGLVVVERNQEALPPSAAKTTTLADGDRLEIVKIVAGG